MRKPNARPQQIHKLMQQIGDSAACSTYQLYYRCDPNAPHAHTGSTTSEAQNRNGRYAGNFRPGPHWTTAHGKAAAKKNTSGEKVAQLAAHTVREPTRVRATYRNAR
jgi:hypothetical protein